MCPDLHDVLAAFQEARPELLFGVPRTYERIHSGVRAVLAADPDHEAIFDDALAVGAEVAAMRARGEAPTGALADAWERADGEHLRPVRELLGLGRGAVRGHVGGADARRDPRLLPLAGRARCRSSTGSRSRRGP